MRTSPACATTARRSGACSCSRPSWGTRAQSRPTLPARQVVRSSLRLPDMYGQNPMHDAARTVRAWSTNQIARFAPRTYLRLTGQTGRGNRELETPQSIAEYFEKCFREYFEILEIAPADIRAYLTSKVVLEYGPGDVPGIALLMIAHGAQRVLCVDRFPMLSESGTNAAVVETLMERLQPEARSRASGALADGRIKYLVRPSGLSGLKDEVDLVISRAVLEHVDDLAATFADMHAALRRGGATVHQVDLKSHGLHQNNPLDFLSWPPSLWRLMYSHKGVPNRWRVSHYRDAIQKAGLSVKRLQATGRAATADVEAVRPHLAAPFRDIPGEELAWLGFWLVCHK